MTETRICRLCSEEKPLDQFEIDSRKKTKYTSRCRSCKYSIDDKAQRAFRSLKRRSSELGIPMEVTPKEIRSLFAMFESCAYCGNRPEKESLLHLEHIVPMSEGGRNTLSNLLPACASCNRSKGPRPIVTFFLDNRDRFPDSNIALVIDYIALLSGTSKESVAQELTDEHVRYVLKQRWLAL